MNAVHLHVCGDSSSSFANISASGGSSPRVWRQLSLQFDSSANRRFISTCVETAPSLRFSFRAITVHLHVCGDSKPSSPIYPSILGSSPRVWRQQSSTFEQTICARFISTCVETASRHREFHAETPVHLHVCGDRAVDRVAPTIAVGSTPRVWRQAIPQKCRAYVPRFISTCVETGGAAQEQAAAEAVHLHVCGDRSQKTFYRKLILGSSPRVWRQGLHRQPLFSPRRFISTCVETGYVFLCQWFRAAVHLHVCGDRILFRFIQFPYRGSSPRVWRQDPPAMP